MRAETRATVAPVTASPHFDTAAILTRLPRVGSALAYVAGGLIVAFGVLLRLPLDAIANTPLPPYITLYPAIVAAAFVGGIRVGLAAMAASVAIAWTLWMAPLSGPPDPARVATAIVYLFTAGGTVLASGGARLLLEAVNAEKAQRERAARESVHRIKNLISVVQSLSHQVAAEAADTRSYRDQLQSRLTSLAVAQDVLLKQDWSDVELGVIVEAALGPFAANEKLEIKPGPQIIAPANAVTGLSMALYELATNALKYGALASAEGFVRVEWGVSEGRAWLEWREVGLRHVAMGEGAGLGSTLIRAALSTTPDASVRYDVRPTSVQCVFDWPAQAQS